MSLKIQCQIMALSIQVFGLICLMVNVGRPISDVVGIIPWSVLVLIFMKE